MTMTTPPNLTAKDFRTPLLKVLGILSNFKESVEVPLDSTYDPIFTMMGIARTEHLEKRIQWAFNEMKGSGLAVGRRAKWALTQQGVDAAQGLVAASTPITVPMPADPTSDDSTGNPVASVGYHPDPYIRHLALNDHPCLGFFTSQSPICSTCLARLECMNAMAAKLAGLALEIVQEEAIAAENARRAALPPPSIASVVAGSVGPAPVPGFAGTTVASAVANGTANVGTNGNVVVAKTPANMMVTNKIPAGAKIIPMTCQAQALCAGCRVNIDLGADAVWVRGTGNGGKSSDMYHKPCYEQASQN